MATLAERLRQEVEEWGPRSGFRKGKEGAPKTFQRALEQRLTGGKDGTSYRAVLAYLSGTSEPSLEWLREAAELLDVRFAWLVTGEGMPTDQAQEISDNFRAWAHEHGAALERFWSSALGIEVADKAFRLELNHLVQLAYRPIKVERDEQMTEELAEARRQGFRKTQVAVAETLVAFKALGFDPAGLPREKYQHYLRTIAEALRFLIADEVNP